MGLKQTLLNLFAKPTTQPNPFSMTPTLIDRDTLLIMFGETAQKIHYYDQIKADYEQLAVYLRYGSVSPPMFKYGFYGDDLQRSYWKMLGPEPSQWDERDDRLLTFGLGKYGAYDLDEAFYERWLLDRFNTKLTTETIQAIVLKLSQHGVSEVDFWLSVLDHVTLWHLPDSALANWVLERVDRYHPSSVAALRQLLLPYLKLLLSRKPAFVKANLPDFLYLSNYNTRSGTREEIVNELLARDKNYFGHYVADLKQQVTDPGSYRMLQLLLARYLTDEHELATPATAYDYLGLVHREMTAKPVHSGFMSYERAEPSGRYELTAALLFDVLLAHEEPVKAHTYLYNWLKACPVPEGTLFGLLADRLGQASVPFLMLGLQVDPNGLHFDVVALAKEILKLLGRFDYSVFHPQIWALTRHKSKQMRELAAVTLAKLGEAAIPEAEKLLNDRKADARQTGALILSLIRTDRAQALLRTALDAEQNDDARDLMLDSLDGLLPAPTTEAEIAAQVKKARLRGKLDAPVAPYLTEKDLPQLYWQASGAPIDATTIRFLLYRQHRAKDIRPDPEARPLYGLIDRQRSAPFAKAVLKAYIDAGADPKGRGCLTVGAMLSDDGAIDLLKTKVNQWAEAGRGKMAEYAVQALALVGSNKALRAVEFYARRYKNKNKNIGAAANEAFSIAADTLGISPFDLADSIIPDFGFDGLFREFTAGDETYRAFIGTDFKLAFLNDDNKLIKTVPKATPPELKEEFKDIGKEVRDIVKAQSGRLEQYLVVQRKWPVEKWQPFFMGNPVMFAYAVRLIWGAFDTRQTLLFAFQCQEDQTLLNDAGDEIDLPTALPAGAMIGMVHPLALTDGQVTGWTGQLADAGVESIFPQLSRRVVTLPDADRILTMDRQFEGVEYGGYGFVSKMEKLGWVRGSVQDAGSIASYYKDFSDLGLTAIVLQQGVLCVGYYDENAALGKVMFVRSGSVKFGNYWYDEPEKDTDKRLVPFGDVPPIVYSEVMADMLFFKENDARTQKND